MKKAFQLFIAAIIIGLIGSGVAISGQGPNQAYTAVNTSGYGAPQNLDANGALITNNAGTSTSLNITSATVVKTVSAGAKRIVKFIVTTAGAAGGIYDASTTGGNAAANLIAIMPATVGIYEVNFPVASGILVTPGASQVVSVSYQ
jgi:hypothetical protein